MPYCKCPIETYSPYENATCLSNIFIKIKKISECSNVIEGCTECEKDLFSSNVLCKAC